MLTVLIAFNMNKSKSIKKDFTKIDRPNKCTECLKTYIPEFLLVPSYRTDIRESVDLVWDRICNHFSCEFDEKRTFSEVTQIWNHGVDLPFHPAYAIVCSL
jgi:hypothetical protein